MSTEAQKQPTASSLLREGSMGELKVVAYWIEKAEQFCFPPKSGGRPFASAWEPLARLSEAEQALQALREEVEGLRRDAALGAAIQRAARDLPDGWQVHVCVERGAGWPILYNPEGDVIECDDIDADDRLTAEVLAAIDAAIRNGGEGVDE
jgi:hypothetical protein